MSKIGIILHGKYEIINEIGRSESVVYLALDKHINTYWAVKLLEGGRRAAAEDFKREVELLAALDHPAIPGIVDQIQLGSDIYVVMNFISGIPLSKKLSEDNATQSELDVKAWFLQMADILNYLHTMYKNGDPGNTIKNPILYLDMKPGNIRLNADGKVKLIDFGTAREFKKGEKLKGESRGTRGFAPPEQYNNGSRLLDERSDIYALGATMWTLLTNEMPPEPPAEIPPVREKNPLVSEGMEQIILKCTRLDPNERYGSAQELIDDLNNIEQFNSSYRKKMNKRMRAFIAAIAACAGLFILSAAGTQGYKQEQSEGYEAAAVRAADYERIGNYDAAADEYIAAIEYSDLDAENYAEVYFDSYDRLYDVLLPKTTDSNYDERTRLAVRNMSDRYIDQPKSPMYQNPDLMLKTVKIALDSGDPSLVSAAENYLSVLNESLEGEDSEDIDSYLIMAQLMGDGAVSPEEVRTAVERLLERSNIQNMSNDDILRNYSLVIKIMSAYPQNFDDPYGKIYELGQDAIEIIQNSGEELTFNGAVQLAKMVASAMQSAAGAQEDKAAKEEYYNRSLEWFNYLDELGGLPETDMAIRKGDVYMGLYNLASTDAAADVSAADIANLDEAIGIYSEVYINEPENFRALVKLADAYLKRAVATGEGVDLAESYYAAAETMKRSLDAGGEGPSHSDSMSFASLSRSIEDARKIYFEPAQRAVQADAAGNGAPDAAAED